VPTVFSPEFPLSSSFQWRPFAQVGQVVDLIAEFLFIGFVGREAVLTDK
jgi:hypothetical protein